MFYLGTALFYTTEKGITGRRAHNPIHPGKRMAIAVADQCRCPSLLCMEKLTAAAAA